ncbi:hypothetical protein AVEN_174269-1, partial [Araneus ventricosus]
MKEVVPPDQYVHGKIDDVQQDTFQEVLPYAVQPDCPFPTVFETRNSHFTETLINFFLVTRPKETISNQFNCSLYSRCSEDLTRQQPNIVAFDIFATRRHSDANYCEGKRTEICKPSSR